MNIKEVCEKFNISQDTLRYYEKVGVIPPVNRTAGGIRDYNEADLGWVQNAVCMRDAGMSVEKLVEYVELFQQGEQTLAARRDLLKEVREEMLEARAKYDSAIERLDYKIGKYEEAVETGVLVWD